MTRALAISSLCLLLWVPFSCRNSGGDGDGDVDADVDGDSDADGDPTCNGEGQLLCGGSCVDVRTDVYNCGSCGAACSDGQVCVDRSCSGIPESCPCPLGSYCDLATNSCVLGCLLDEHCPESQICFSDVRECRTGCREDTDCGAGQICDDTTLLCRDGCRSDGDCPGEDLICDERSLTCRRGCRGDGDCEPGEVCDADLVCTPGCEESSTCPDGMVCDDGTCLPGVCSPGETVCVDNAPVTCNASGSGYLPGGEACAHPSPTCHQGRCVWFYDGFEDGDAEGWRFTHDRSSLLAGMSEVGSPDGPNSLTISETYHGDAVYYYYTNVGRGQPTRMSLWLQVNVEYVNSRICFGTHEFWGTGVRDPVFCIQVAINRFYDGIYSDYEVIGDVELGRWYHIEAVANYDTGRLDISIDGVVVRRSRSFVATYRVESITIDVSSPELGDVLYDGFLIEE